MQITSFSGEFSFLSNFFPSDILLGKLHDQKVYPSVEHAFQAAKTLDPKEREAIRRAPTPGQAKRLGRKATLCPNWEDMKFHVMLGLLRKKFQIPELREKLLGTGDAILIEGNTWGDVTWGCVWKEEGWVGENWLGKLLMLVRSELEN